MDPMVAVALAAVAVFIAEFGDKSQLLVLAFATRHPALPVAAGLVLATAVLQAVSVAVGAAVGAVLPTHIVAAVAGIAFIAVGIWTLRGDDHELDSVDAAGRARRSGPAVVVAVASTIALAELGDKTMLVTFGLAATQGALPTWIGATAGMAGAGLIAIAVGRQLGTRLDPARVRLVSGLLFILGGLVVLAGVVLGLD